MHNKIAYMALDFHHGMQEKPASEFHNPFKGDLQ